MRGRNSINLGSLSGTSLGDADVAAEPGPATVATTPAVDHVGNAKTSARNLALAGALAIGLYWLIEGRHK